MEELKLTNENYHSVEMRKRYMGYSQFKTFLECESEALAKVNGEVEEKKTPALLFGSYVDAYFSNELDEFIPSNPELFTRSGTLKADYARCQDVINAIENDEKMHKAMQGEHQVIMTGFIAGVEFKIKVDSYHPGKVIIDQKVMKDMQPVWIEKYGMRERVNFVKAYRYDLEGAIYQEIVRQNTGEKLPFVLAVTTKEEVPEQALLRIDQEDLDLALAEVIEKAPRFDRIKKGLEQPKSCGKCNYCKSRKKVEKIVSFHTKDPDNF